MEKTETLNTADEIQELNDYLLLDARRYDRNIEAQL